MVQRMAQVLVDEAVAGAITDSAQEHVDVIAQAAQAEHEFQENNRFVGKVNVAMTHLVKDEAVAKYVDEHFYDAPWDFDFFKKMDKIMQVEYKSTPMEVLACRKATTGYHEYFFTVDKSVLLFVDVGGQRKERATWVKKELSERTNVIRYSKGPDGTRGFTMVRRSQSSAPAAVEMSSA